jgi:transposase
MSSGTVKKGRRCTDCEALQKELQETRRQLRETRRELKETRRELKEKQQQLDEAVGRCVEQDKQIEKLSREAHRQVAVFRRREEQRRVNPKKPGRKRNHPPSWRKPPPEVDEERYVPLTGCPHCRGPVEKVRRIEQTIEELVFKVWRTRLITEVGRCANCGKVVHTTDPLQVTRATGAAGTHLGPQTLGFAAFLNKQLGLSLRSTCKLLRACKFSLTPGGLSQALHRARDRLQNPFAQLLRDIRNSNVVYADETGWWLGGEHAYLWVFTTPERTLYVIDNRSQEVVRRILGDDHKGVLVSDCLASYDPHPGRKSKCFAHHLRARKEAEKQAPHSALLHEFELFMLGVLALHKARPKMDPEVYAQRLPHLEAWVDRLLSTPADHPAAEAIANRLRKQRPHLLTCLYVEGVDPTNNQAERQLRPAVIARKLSCGNKTDAGARTFEVLASLAATCAQQGRSFIEFVAEAFRLQGEPTPLAGLPP